MGGGGMSETGGSLSAPGRGDFLRSVFPLLGVALSGGTDALRVCDGENVALPGCSDAARRWPGGRSNEVWLPGSFIVFPGV